MLAQVEVVYVSLLESKRHINTAEFLIHLPLEASNYLIDAGYYPMRGLPTDISFRSKINYERAIALSGSRPQVYPTWLTYEEVIVSFGKLIDDGILDQLPLIEAVLAFLKSLKESGVYENIRLIFWLNF